MPTIMMIAISGPSSGDRAYPQFRNDTGIRRILIGTREFECVGQSPPDDHAHVYLEMGAKDEILCPYCGTQFAFDSRLDAFAAIPADGVSQTH